MLCITCIFFNVYFFGQPSELSNKNNVLSFYVTSLWYTGKRHSPKNKLWSNNSWGHWVFTFLLTIFLRCLLWAKRSMSHPVVSFPCACSVVTGRVHQRKGEWHSQVPPAEGSVGCGAFEVTGPILRVLLVTLLTLDGWPVANHSEAVSSSVKQDTPWLGCLMCW